MSFWESIIYVLLGFILLYIVYQIIAIPLRISDIHKNVQELKEFQLLMCRIAMSLDDKDHKKCTSDYPCSECAFYQGNWNESQPCKCDLEKEKK